MFKFNRLLSTILYCVLIAVVVPSIHSKGKTDKKEKASKKSKIDKKISTEPFSEEKETERILKSLKESVVKIEIAKTAEKEAYAKRDQVVTVEKTAEAAEKSTEVAEIAAYKAKADAYNLAMKKNNESWKAYLKTGSKYNPLWQQKTVVKKYHDDDSNESSPSEKDKPTDTKKTAREKRIKVVYDAYTVGIKAKRIRGKSFYRGYRSFYKNSANIRELYKSL